MTHNHTVAFSFATSMPTHVVQFDQQSSGIVIGRRIYVIHTLVVAFDLPQLDVHLEEVLSKKNGISTMLGTAGKRPVAVRFGCNQYASNQIASDAVVLFQVMFVELCVVVVDLLSVVPVVESIAVGDCLYWSGCRRDTRLWHCCGFARDEFDDGDRTWLGRN
jgi:hypothetical protein